MKIRLTARGGELPTNMSHELTIALAEIFTDIVHRYGVTTAKEKAPFETGELQEGIGAEDVVITSEGKVQVTMYSKAPHSMVVEKGSGVYAGGEPIEIVPKKKKVLQFADGTFSMHATVLGQEAQPFMHPALVAIRKPLMLAIKRTLRRLASAKRGGRPSLGR